VSLRLLETFPFWFYLRPYSANYWPIIQLRVRTYIRRGYHVSPIRREVLGSQAFMAVSCRTMRAHNQAFLNNRHQTDEKARVDQGGRGIGEPLLSSRLCKPWQRG
jgi:hypothetical protein